MTYGQLIDQAKRQLSRCLTARVTLPDPADALAVCDARASLYRAIAGALTLHLNLPHSPGRRSFVEYNGEGIGRREITLLAVLHADLTRSARTGGDTWQPPADVCTIATRLRAAADTAGAAFDLLAGHLSPADPRLQLNSSPLRRGGTRVTALDAVRLTRALAQLDRKLEFPLRRAARPELDNHHLYWLTAVADDCKRVTREGLREFATAIEHALRAPDRATVDQLDLAVPVLHPRTALTSLSEAAELLAKIRAVANPELLSTRDLSAIASACARACVLIAYTDSADLPAGTALQTARRWRALHTDLAPFASRDYGQGLAVYARQFCRWADPYIRHGPKNPYTANRPHTTFTQIITDLTRLADTLTTTIDRLIEREDLLLPFDPDTRGREHLYAAATPSHPRVARLRRTATQTANSTRDLAHLLRPPASTDQARSTAASTKSPLAISSPQRRTSPPQSPPPLRPAYHVAPRRRR